MFAWQDYLSLARYLEQNAQRIGFPEAAQRSAISRAYYSTYNIIEGWAATYRAKPFSPSGRGDDHHRLRQWLKNVNFRGEAQEMGILWDWRRQCDYYSQLKVQPLSVACVQALQKAEAILRNLRIVP